MSNSLPTVEVLGLHALPVTEALILEQCEILYPFADPSSAEGKANIRTIREQLESVVLIELLVTRHGHPFDVMDIEQKGTDQAPYRDTFLSPDGSKVLAEEPLDPLEDDTYRLAFYMHYYDSTQPLNTSFGPVDCPSPTPMPERLTKMVPFEPVD